MTNSRIRFALGPALALAGVGCGANVASPSTGDLGGVHQSAIIALQGSLDLVDSTTGPAEVGQAQTYTTVITNPTAQTFTNVFGNVNAEAFTAEPTMSSAKASAGHCLRNGSQNFICFFGTMEPGATITVTSAVVPAAEGTLIFVPTP